MVKRYEFSDGEFSDPKMPAQVPPSVLYVSLEDYETCRKKLKFMISEATEWAQIAKRAHIAREIAEYYLERYEEIAKEFSE